MLMREVVVGKEENERREGQKEGNKRNERLNGNKLRAVMVARERLM